MIKQRVQSDTVARLRPAWNPTLRIYPEIITRSRKHKIPSSRLVEALAGLVRSSPELLGAAELILS